MEVIKRDGKTVDFDREKISAAINKANAEVKEQVKKILMKLLIMLKV